jgi:hypothetical protein
MEIIIMILAALFVLSGLDARYWGHRREASHPKKVRRAVPRALPVHRAQRPAMGTQPLWRGHAPRPSTADGARWWWE